MTFLINLQVLLERLQRPMPTDVLDSRSDHPSDTTPSVECVGTSGMRFPGGCSSRTHGAVLYQRTAWRDACGSAGFGSDSRWRTSSQQVPDPDTEPAAAVFASGARADRSPVSPSFWWSSAPEQPSDGQEQGSSLGWWAPPWCDLLTNSRFMRSVGTSREGTWAAVHAPRRRGPLPFQSGWPCGRQTRGNEAWTPKAYCVSARRVSSSLRLVALSLEDQPRNPVPDRRLVLTDSLRREMRQMHDISWVLMSLVHLNYRGVLRCCPMTDPEEWGYLPYGHLSPAGEGANACLYCGHYEHHPTLLCVPWRLPLAPGHVPNHSIVSGVSWLDSQENLTVKLLFGDG